MIEGLGIDLVEISRMKKLVARESFLKKVFTPSERRDCEGRFKPEVSLAGRFAAKEAVMKALGTGWAKGVAWTDITITNDDLGKPTAVLMGEARSTADRAGISEILISISHTQDHAVAQAVAIGSR